MQDPIELDPTASAEPTTQPTAEELRPAQSVQEGVETITEAGRTFVDTIPLILTALALFAVFVFLGWLVKWGVRRLSSRYDTWGRWNLIVGLSRLAQGVVIILGLLVSAVIVFPGFTPAKLLQFLGFGSVAIGFAFRDVLQNYLAGILLLFTEPFRVGDQVVFKEFEGTVEDIQTRATFMRTYDGRRVVIPNAELFTESVVVNTAFENRRIEYDIGIGYGDDIEAARSVLLDVLKREPTARSDPAPDVLTYELGGEAVVLRARWWIDPPQRRDALESRDRVLTEAKRRLTEAGIDLPFPTQQILFHDQTESTDGDRRRQREGWPASPETGGGNGGVSGGGA